MTTSFEATPENAFECAIKAQEVGNMLSWILDYVASTDIVEVANFAHMLLLKRADKAVKASLVAAGAYAKVLLLENKEYTKEALIAAKYVDAVTEAARAVESALEAVKRSKEAMNALLTQ
jgi:hypothetical protein